MSNCQDIHEMIVEALYGDLDGDRKVEFDAHLQSCPECARQYRQMVDTLRIMSARETIEPDEEFWTGYSERLVENLESEYETPLRIRRPIRHPYFVWRISAVAALLMVGIFLGKWIWTDEQPEGLVSDATVSTPDQANTETVLIDNRVQAYLQKSQVLLLALANFDPQTDDAVTLNLPIQKRISESLVQEAAYLKNELTDPAQMRLRELVGDLEIILLQIANLEAENDISGIEMVKSGIDRQGILLKINLQEIRRFERKPAQTPKTGESTI